MDIAGATSNGIAFAWRVHTAVRSDSGLEISAGSLDTYISPTIVARLLVSDESAESRAWRPEQLVCPDTLFEAPARSGIVVEQGPCESPGVADASIVRRDIGYWQTRLAADDTAGAL